MFGHPLRWYAIVKQVVSYFRRKPSYAQKDRKKKSSEALFGLITQILVQYYKKKILGYAYITRKTQIIYAFVGEFQIEFFVHFG